MREKNPNKQKHANKRPRGKNGKLLKKDSAEYKSIKALEAQRLSDALNHDQAKEPNMHSQATDNGSSSDDSAQSENLSSYD